MVQTSLVKRTKGAKKASAISIIAMKMAKEQGDPIQRKAAKYKKLFVAAKQAILNKYKSRATQEWNKEQTQK